jgi:hypothetical protein
MLEQTGLKHGGRAVHPPRDQPLGRHDERVRLRQGHQQGGGQAQLPAGVLEPQLNLRRILQHRNQAPDGPGLRIPIEMQEKLVVTDAEPRVAERQCGTARLQRDQMLDRGP